RRARGGCRAEAENRLVEHADECRTVAAHERLDERAANEIGVRIAGQARLSVSAFASVFAEQDRAAYDGRPQPVRASEQRDERLPQLLCAERAVLEQRELPAVERLAEIGIVVRRREPRTKVGRECAAEGVEPGRDRKSTRLNSSH